MRKIVLAQRDLDFHSRIGVVAEDSDDAGESLPVRRWLFDQLCHDYLAGLCIGPHFRGNQDILADALVLRDQIKDAAVRIDTPDDFAVGAGQHINDDPFGAATPIDTDLARRRAIAMQRLVHFLRRKEQIRAAVVGHQKAVTVGVSLHRSGYEIELGDDAELTLAIGHQLPIAFHRSEAAEEGFVSFAGSHSEHCGEIVGAHRNAMLAQTVED